jgi:hypothetical protein
MEDITYCVTGIIGDFTTQKFTDWNIITTGPSNVLNPLFLKSIKSDIAGRYNISNVHIRIETIIPIDKQQESVENITDNISHLHVS